MKTLFLTSSVSGVAHDLPRHFPKGTKGLRLAFIDTAAEVEVGDKQWLKDDRQVLVKAGFSVDDYTYTGKTKRELLSDLSKANVLYFSGGNTPYALQQLQKCHGIEIVRELVVQKCKTYIGTSAGSVMAGPDISPTNRLEKLELAPNIKGFIGLNLVNFVIFPHWGTDHFRKLYIQEYERFKRAYKDEQYPIVLLNDSQYIYVKDDWSQMIDVSKTV